MEENNESMEFWEEKKQETGKEILFKSFARFIGETAKGSSELSGLLYATEDRVYFEDFEKSSMLDMFMKKKRKYEKYTMNFLVPEVENMRKVSASSAAACINGELDDAKPQGAVMGLFNSPVWEIRFKSGTSYFFELFEPAALIKLLGN
ncbi:MAG TPA: hypothetical protein DCO79_08565 [Spirochaeta sp.]|nr:hypothetical protein [Spirochaeta sp.]